MQRTFLWSPPHTRADGALAEPLAVAFAEMLAHARASARAAQEAPSESLHDYRRALRRAEALALFARPSLRRFPRHWLDAGLAHALRRTGDMRDAAALADRVARLGELRPELAVSDPVALDALGAVVGAWRDSLASGENVAWRLRKNVRALAGLAEIFETALRKVDGEALGEGLRRVYRAARRAWRTARASGRDGDVHAWRRAARGLRYALELLASRAEQEPGAMSALALAEARDSCRAMVRTLGLATDMMALAAVVRAADVAPLDAARDAFIAAFAEVQETEVARAHLLAEVFFAPAPRAFLMPAPVAAPPAEVPAPSPGESPSPPSPEG